MQNSPNFWSYNEYHQILMEKHVVTHTPGPFTLTFSQLSFSQTSNILPASYFSSINVHSLTRDSKVFFSRKSHVQLFRKLSSQLLITISKIQCTLIHIYFWSSLLSGLINSLDPRRWFSLKSLPRNISHKHLMTGPMIMTENQRFRSKFLL